MTDPAPGGTDLLARYEAGGFYDELLGAEDEHTRATDAIRAMAVGLDEPLGYVR